MLVLFILLIIVITPLGLFIHEFGHAMTAIWFHSDRSLIELGRGRKLCQMKIGRLHVHFHLLLFSGARSLNDRKRSYTWNEKAIISIAGPFSNGAVAAFLFLTPAHSYSEFLWLFGLFNGYLAIANAIPFSIKGKKSDGYLVLDTLRMPKN